MRRPELRKAAERIDPQKEVAPQEENDEAGCGALCGLATPKKFDVFEIVSDGFS
jgi:hypothetical protein